MPEARAASPLYMAWASATRVLDPEDLLSAFRTQKGFFEGLILRLVAVKRNCSIELQDVLVRAGDFNEPIRLESIAVIRG